MGLFGLFASHISIGAPRYVGRCQALLLLALGPMRPSAELAVLNSTAARLRTIPEVVILVVCGIALGAGRPRRLEDFSDLF